MKKFAFTFIVVMFVAWVAVAMLSAPVSVGYFAYQVISDDLSMGIALWESVKLFVVMISLGMLGVIGLVVCDDMEVG